jgi:beta-ureidopropionase / N-carbamoyl-L-amino-acid hydrolase
MLTIKPERLLADLTTLRKIGGSGLGVVRQAFTATDIEGRRWLAGRMQEAGLQPVWDEIGNLFGIAPGAQPSLLLGSHSDSQPEGGWLDGAYGVMCGLEVARAAQEAGVGGVSVVSFADEEGTFAPLMGSRHWTDVQKLDELRGHADVKGRRLGETLAEIPEIRGAANVSCETFRAYIEPHIEQGPTLDLAQEDIGVVTTIVGMRRVEVVIEGEQNHAGTTPMTRRRDAVIGFVRFAAAVDAAFRAAASPVAVWTFGQVNVYPNAVSIVPGKVRTVLQVRDVTTEGMDALVNKAQDLAAEMNRDGIVQITTALVGAIEPTDMNANLVEALSTAAAQRAPGRWRRMHSGALHDAGMVSKKMPAAMLFVPSLRGISHSFDEDTSLRNLVIGCEVLADATAALM